jgi:type I restriction enzyme S subunit
MSTTTYDPSPLGNNVLAIDTWSSRNESPSFEEFDYIDIASIDREKKTIVGTTLTDAADAPSRARQIVQTNDVLVSTVRPNLNAVAVVPEELNGAIASTGFCVLRSHPERLCHRYLYHWVRSPFFVADMVRKATGASYPAVSDAIIKASMLPLPPLSEQKRIADILDKADSIRRKRQEALNKIETLSLSSYRHQFGHPIAASDSLPLGECVTMLSGGTPSKSNDAYWNGDFPWVSPKDMKVDYISFTEDHVTDLAFQETTLKKLPAEAILIVVRGMILAHTIPVALTDVPVAINQDMKALIANDGYDPHFLCWSLKAAHNYILGKVATAAHGTKRLEVEHLASFPIPRVTLSEQRHFARIVQKIRYSRDRLATGVPEDLFNSLVQRAFKGEL